MNIIQNSILPDVLMKHGADRETFEWVSSGKRHDQPPVKTVLKDIGDSHLLHIFGFIKLNKLDESIINIIETEILYRTQFYIFVKDK